MYSRFWTMLGDSDGFRTSQLQYSYRGFVTNGTTKLASLAIHSPRGDVMSSDTDDIDESEEDKDEEEDLVNGFVSRATESPMLVWSEPLAPLASPDDVSNTLGISFPSA